MDRLKRRFFPEEFKREAVAQVETGGRSVAAVAAELGLCDTVLRKWVRQRGSGNRSAATLARPDMPVPPTAAVTPSPADQAGWGLAAMDHYDDPAVARALGWDAEAVAARGRELRRSEGRP